MFRLLVREFFLQLRDLIARRDELRAALKSGVDFGHELLRDGAFAWGLLWGLLCGGGDGEGDDKRNGGEKFHENIPFGCERAIIGEPPQSLQASQPNYH